MVAITHLSNRLRSERDRLQLSQPEAARRLGVPFATYRSYESGRNEPPISLLAKMTRAGMDAVFVATGRSLVDRKADAIDWVVFRDIVREVCNWSASRARPLDGDEIARYIEIAYRCSAKTGRDAAIELLEEMRTA